MKVNIHKGNQVTSQHNIVSSEVKSIFGTMVDKPDGSIGAKFVFEERLVEPLKPTQKTLPEKVDMFHDYYTMVKDFNTSTDESKRNELAQKIEQKKRELKEYAIPTELA